MQSYIFNKDKIYCFIIFYLIYIMVFLHIDTKNYKKDDEKLIKQLNDIINGNKNSKTFILYYMEGCGPCNATRPEWAKLSTVMKHLDNNNSVAIVDIDQLLSDKIKGQTSPSGFPTMRFITDGGKTVENYEDSTISTKDRTIDSFVEWVKSKMNHSNNFGNKKRRTAKKYRGFKGGKWSRKYKKSINCKRPKGFSQRQYCKYGRKK